MKIDLSTRKRFKSCLKKIYDKKIFPTTVKGPVVHYVFNFCDPSNNYYIEATSKDECNYLLLFKVANGGFCDDLYDEILESEEPIESIEDLNNEIDKLLEKDILYNLRVINFVKIE